MLRRSCSVRVPQVLQFQNRATTGGTLFAKSGASSAAIMLSNMLLPSVRSSLIKNSSSDNGSGSGGNRSDRASSPNDNDNNNSNTNSHDDNTDGHHNSGNIGGGDEAVNKFLHRVTMTVAGITVVAVSAWYMSFPSGRHVSWREVRGKVDALQDIRVYQDYAQLTLGDEYAFVGVRPNLSGHTDEQVRDLLARQQELQQQRQQHQKSGGGGEDEATNSEGEKKHTTTATSSSSSSSSSRVVPVTYAGIPFGQRFLHWIEVWSFVVPFIFFPLFTLVVSRAAASIVYDNAKFTTAIGSRREQLLTQAGEQFQIAKRTNVRFRDIAGMTEAKAEIVEIVDFLRHPERFTKMGAKIPAGAVLLGPPGTGKTMLAKAVAGESGTPFIACCGSDFVELYAGMGALRVRKLFELARTQKKCIIYIDEIDAIGCKRTGSGMGEQSEQEHTLNELLTQLDGFNKEKDRIIVLASTNAEQSMLDTALMRPGRFDRIVNIEAPVLAERVQLFETYLKTIRLLPEKKVVEKKKENKEEETSSNGTELLSSSSSSSPPASSPADGETSSATATTTVGEDQANKVKDDSKLAPPPPTQDDTTSKSLIVVPQQETAERGQQKQLQQQDEEDSTQNNKEGSSTNTLENSSSSSGGDDNNITTTTTAEQQQQQRSRREEERDQKGDDIARDKRQLNDETPEFLALVTDFAQRMSGLCPGFVGADISSVCNEAAILAAREKASIVSMSHLERSIDRVLAGIEHRSRVLSDFEKKVVSHHEAGHAVAGWFLGRADPLMKVSIVPRGGKALGYAQYLPSENQLRTSAEIEDSICVTLGGRVAERIFFDHLSTGASDDLQKVRRMAYMHASSFGRGTAVVSPGSSSTRYSKPYGEQTEKAIDDAAKQLVDRLYQRTYDLLMQHKDLMAKLADHLLTHEVLTHSDIVHYMGVRQPRPSDHGANIF